MTKAVVAETTTTTTEEELNTNDDENDVGVLQALAQEYSELEREISGMQGMLSRLREEEKSLVEALQLAQKPKAPKSASAASRGKALQRLEEALMLEDSDSSDDDSDTDPKTTG